MIIEFQVDDVDKEYERLKTLVSEWVQGPTTMPWGNRSMLFHDPDRNLVNLFTPVTEGATKSPYGLRSGSSAWPPAARTRSTAAAMSSTR